MPNYDPALKVAFNNLYSQTKNLKDAVSFREWNMLWNILTKQADQNAEVLKKLKVFLVGDLETEVEIPDTYNSLFDMINDIIINNFNVEGISNEERDLINQIPDILNSISNLSGSGVHIGEEAPTDPNVILWIDTSTEDVYNNQSSYQETENSDGLYEVNQEYDDQGNYIGG